MNRRQYTSKAALAIFISLSGCLGEDRSDDTNNTSPTDESWSPVIKSTEPEVSSGEETVITTEADRVAGLRYVELPDSELFDIATNEARISPDVSGVYDSDPPIWQWESRKSVTVEVPVQVAEDTDSGEYEYTVEVYDDEEVLQAESVTESFVISVEPAQRTPEQIRECLPEYDQPPADADEQHERANEVWTAMSDCVMDHDWVWGVSLGYDDEIDKWYVCIDVHDREPAEEHVPQEWGDVPIRICVGEPPEPE